jgi:hypothetical protein
MLVVPAIIMPQVLVALKDLEVFSFTAARMRVVGLLPKFCRSSLLLMARLTTLAG